MVFTAGVKHSDSMPKDAKSPRRENRLRDEQSSVNNGFVQGPGATTIVFIDPTTGKRARTDAAEMRLFQQAIDATNGATPVLDEKNCQHAPRV